MNLGRFRIFVSGIRRYGFVPPIVKSILPPPANLVSTFESNTEALVVVLQEKERIREADLADKERGLLALIRVADRVQRFAAPIFGTVEGIVKQLFFVCFQLGDNQRRQDNTPQLYMCVCVSMCILFLVLHPGWKSIAYSGAFCFFSF